MSAYVVDPKTIDLLLAWVKRHGTPGDPGLMWRNIEVPKDAPDLERPRELECDCLEDQQGIFGPFSTWRPGADINATGQLLLDQNVRSVTARYPDETPDTLPGPADLARVHEYEYRHPLERACDLATGLPKEAWVIRACDCWRYQSCETADHEETAAWAVVDAIREDAINSLVDKVAPGAPWGIK